MSSTRLDGFPLDLPRSDGSPSPTQRPDADRGVWLGYLLLWVGPVAAFLAAVLLTPAR